VTVEPYDEATAREVAATLRAELARRGVEVAATLFQSPDVHWGRPLVEGITVILRLMALLALVLSLFLITNTFTALLTQQTDQIGVMKALGARRGAIVRVYLAQVLAIGLAALAVSLPPALLFVDGMTRWFLELFNIELTAFQLSPAAVAVQVAAAVVAPLAAALPPVWRAGRMSVRAALSTYGLGQDYRAGRLDRAVERLAAPLPADAHRGGAGEPAAPPRPLRLHGRDPGAGGRDVPHRDQPVGRHLPHARQRAGAPALRRRGRLRRHRRRREVARGRGRRGRRWSTRPRCGGCAAPSCGAATRASTTTPASAPSSWRCPTTPGTGPSSWPGAGSSPATRPRAGHLRGTAERHGLAVGDRLAADLGPDGRFEGTIVGTYRRIYGGGFVSEAVYAPRPALLALLGGEPRGTRLFARTGSPDLDAALRDARAVTDALRADGLEPNPYVTRVKLEERAFADARFSSTTGMLFSLALLVGAIGAIGLSGALSLSVAERTREIGVMRALGASTRSLFGLYLAEGVLQALLAWLVAVPIGWALAGRWRAAWARRCWRPTSTWPSPGGRWARGWRSCWSSRRSPRCCRRGRRRGRRVRESLAYG
jgi:putative ABC transport system permease protein